MQKIDQEKLSEFTDELSAFQVEASKTASVDVYDRFTISKLEDHVIDLCQLSVDASHSGLQYLCVRLRENISDHFITGTNISNDEFALMAEWKSLVKAYLINGENEGVVNALAINLSKSAWTYPLKANDTDEVISILLGRSSYDQLNSTSSDNTISSEEAEEFDAYMAESNASLADVFESLNDDDVIEDSIVNYKDDKEPSIAEFFENDVPSKATASLNENQLNSQQAVNVEDKSNSSSENEQSETDQVSTSLIEDELFVADEDVDEIEDDGEFGEDLSGAEAVFGAVDDASTDNAQVSEQESEQVDQDTPVSIADDLFVADDAIDNSDNEEFNKDLSVTEAVISDLHEENTQSSEQADLDVDSSDAALLVDELFVADEDVAENSDDDEFNESLSAVEAVINNSQEDNIQSSEQADSDFDNSDAASLVDELFVADDSIAEAEYDNELDENLSKKPSFEDANQQSVSEIADELFVNEEDSDKEEAFESEYAQDNQPVEPETVYIEPVEKNREAPRSIIEAYVGAMAGKIHENKPKALEQELIEQPLKTAPIQKLEPIDSILLKYPDWSEDQKELLSLILSEVHDVVDQQDEALSVLHEGQVVEQDALDMIVLYSEQIERMSSAAEMVGLDALQKLCELIGFHFGDLEKSSTEMIVSSEERIRKWPFIIYSYLKDINNESAHQEAIKYISDDAWARTIREDIKADLKEAFSHSTIHVDETVEGQRITKATPEDVDITVPDDVQAELLDGLLQELPHQTEEFSEAIQQLIKDDYLTQLEVTQRIAHTIKGAANTVGIAGVATLTHHLEDILQALLKAKAKPSADLHIGLIDASDCLEQMTEYLLGQGDQPDDAVQTMQVILDWANYIDEFGVPTDNVNKSSPTSVQTESVEPARVEENKEIKVKDNKAKSPQDASLRVPANMIDELINQSGESIIATSQMHENVEILLSSMRDIKKNKDNVYSLSQQLEHLIDVQGFNDKFSSSDKDEKFDPLELDQYNELHTYSRRLIEATADSVELIKDLEDRLFSLESVIVDQTRAQKDNQYAILKTRMMPVESVVARLKRGVRQAAKISGKSVELEVLGVDTLLDSKILNNLIDPLMHLLRNSVDHGIEANDVREANGKPLPGVIKLTFAQVGERLEINCEDDGIGLNAEQIKARAIDKGMIPEDQDISDDEIHQIIMQHGFSTRDEVTQLSGRGVGMDVVYSNIKDLNGSIVINSEMNKGMNVELSLPVSLLTAHALLIPTISGSMAVSASGIEEILQVNIDDLIETEYGLILHVEDKEYPAVHLEQLLKMRLTASSDKKKSFTALLVDEFGGQKKVVIVNEILSVRDIIIKPLSHYLPKAIGLVGATVLGNGDIAPVVDVADLLSQQSNVIGKLESDQSIELEETHQASVLVVEDSISTRRSLAEFMQDLNYKVFTAKDGVEAIEVMRDHSPTLLLTDLEMPRMNGLELTSYVRSHDETKDIPIIMLTSRTTEKHRQEAKSIGVNEYLSKPFVEDLLLEKVQSLAVVQ